MLLKYMHEASDTFFLDISLFAIMMLAALPMAFDLIKENHIYGVRTKWSMHNKTTWKKTNKLAGMLLFFGNLVSLIAYIVFPKPEVFVLLIVAFTLLPGFYSIYYSYKIYKEEIAKASPQSSEAAGNPLQPNSPAQNK